MQGDSASVRGAHRRRVAAQRRKRRRCRGVGDRLGGGDGPARWWGDAVAAGRGLLRTAAVQRGRGHGGVEQHLPCVSVIWAPSSSEGKLWVSRAVARAGEEDRVFIP
jgi:hypothetical protein